MTTTAKRTWQRKVEAYVDEDLYHAIHAAAWRAHLPISQWLKKVTRAALEQDGQALRQAE